MQTHPTRTDVVAGVDGSPESLAAAHWAAQEALRRGAGLALVHAWHFRPRPEPDVPLGTTERDWAEETLREAVDSVRAAHPALTVDADLVSGSAVSALLGAAPDARLLVLGSLGLGGVAGFVTGSVSQRVVSRSPRPVVLVRAGQSAAAEHLPAVDGVSPDEIPEIPFRSVVVGLDLGRPCDELIEFAFDAARRRLTDLRAVHVADGQDAAEGGARALAELLLPWRGKYPQVPVSETVPSGRPAAELVRAAEGAGLAVVGRRTGGPAGDHTGPVTRAVLHHVSCPVAVVPHA